MSARICQGARSAYWPGSGHRWRKAMNDLEQMATEDYLEMMEKD